MLAETKNITCSGKFYWTHGMGNSNALVCCPSDRYGIVYKPAPVILCCKHGVGTSGWRRGCNSGGNVYPTKFDLNNA